MNTARQVDEMINQWKAEGKSKQEIVWNTALACVGWSYVYSAWGAECTPAERRKRYRMCPSHKTIKTKCKAFDSGNCSGCQWYPGGERTRCFDCRGFTDWCLNRIGFDLYGDTCSVQWNTAKNWKCRGEINTMPRDTLCCLFVKKDGKWTHTGFGLNDATCECSSGVQYFSSRNKKWTHWAVPACFEGDTPVPTPTPEPTPTPSGKPTLKRGSKGEYVRMAQTLLFEKGYDLGKCGIDGDFGSSTEKAVKQFQSDNGLKVDGIIGDATWSALESPTVLYTVTIPHLPKNVADELCSKYFGAVMTEERGNG